MFSENVRAVRWRKLIDAEGIGGSFVWGDDIPSDFLKRRWLCWYVVCIETWDMFLTMIPTVMMDSGLTCEEEVVREAVRLLAVLGDRPETVMAGLRWIRDNFGEEKSELRL